MPGGGTCVAEGCAWRGLCVAGGGGHAWSPFKFKFKVNAPSEPL